MTKSRYRKNPKYEQGDVIRKNLRRENLRRSYDFSIPYQQALVGADSRHYYPSNTGISDNEFFPNIDDQGNIIPSEDSTPGIFSSIGHFLFGDYEHAADRWREASIADTWRLFHEKRLQAETTNNQNKVAEATQNLKEIENAEKYADLVDQKTNLEREYNFAVQQQNTPAIQELGEKLVEVNNEILSFQNKIKTEGKKNGVNVQLFFDPNKAGLSEGMRIAATNLLGDNDPNSKWYNPISGLEYGLSMVGNIAQSIQQGIDKIIYPNASSGAFTRRAIKQSSSDDSWTDGLFEGYTNGNTNKLRQQAEELKNYWTDELDKRSAILKEVSNKYKNGAWYFDPQKINPKFRYFSENNDAGIIGGLLPDQLAYSLAEMGSSYSDFENMAAMMITDLSAGAAAKGLSFFATKINPYTRALSILKDFSELRAAGRAAEAAKLQRRVAEAQKTISLYNTRVNAAEKALGVGTQAANLYFINRMREHETNSEVIDAWSNRVLQNSMSKGANMQKVLDVSKQYLEQIGISTDNMTDIDVVQHALAYDIPTGDSTFEKEKEEGVKGLRKVYNDNMALAVKDYFEAFPFLNYSSSFLKSILKREGNKFADQTYNAVAKSWIDRTYQKIAGNSLNKVGKKLATKHTLEFLAKRARQAGYIATLEGIEEGQQELLQSRYSRGVYDDYNTPTSTLPLASIMEDTNLASDAVAAYFGILYGDPDNDSHQIRRAMQIGATTGLLMGGISFGALSNVLPSTGKDNIRNLIGQIRNDKLIGRLVGEAYGTAQDDAHLDLFYKAFDQHGINNERLRKSLQDLKLFKGSNVTDEYIDRDIDLVDNLWYAYNNKILDQLLKSKNVEKGSDQHRQAVKLLARYLTQEQDAAKHVEHDNFEAEQQVNTQWREILDAIRSVGENEDDAVNVRTDNIVRELHKDYQEYLKAYKGRRSQWADEIEKLSKKKVPQEWEIKKLEELRQKDNEFMSQPAKEFLEFAEKRIESLYTYRLLLNAKKQIEQLNNRKQLLDEISKELGIDISPSRIQSIIDSISKKRDELYQILENEDVRLQNEVREYLNKNLKEQNKKNKAEGRPRQQKLKLIENIASRLEKRYGVLPNQDEIDHIQQRSLLNLAVLESAREVARAFARGKIDPRVAYRIANPLQWKSLSDAEKEAVAKQINEERAKNGERPLNLGGIAQVFNLEQQKKVEALKKGAKDYEDHLHKHTDMDDTVKGEDVDAESMQRDAAINLLNFELASYEDLKRINHREYLRNTTPVEMRRRAEEGDEDAKQVLREEEQKEVSQSAEVKPEREDKSSVELNDEGPSSSVENIEIGYDVSDNPIQPDPAATVSGETDPSQVDASTVEMDPALAEEYAERSNKEKELRRMLGMDDEEQGSQEIDPEDTAEDDVSIEDEPETGIDDTRALYQLMQYGETEYDSYLHTRSERTVQKSDEIYTDFLGQTFKYFPDEYYKNGEKVKPPVLQNVFMRDGKVVKEPIKLRNNATLKTGFELGKKLLIPGWFEKAEKYFVITQDQSDSEDVNNTDNFVVAMIIQDGDDAYATFMEGLKRKTSYGKLTGGYEYLRAKMQQMFYSYFDYNGKRYFLRDSEGNIIEENHQLGVGIARRRAFILQNPSVDPSTVTIKMANDWYLNKTTKGQKDQIDFEVRKFLSGTHPVHTNAHIEEQIQTLKETRDAIINAVLNKDRSGNYIFRSSAEEMNNVVPARPRISDGAINEQKDDEGYVFRKLTDGGFGMSTNLEKLTEQIASGEVRLGVGRGERAYGDSKGKIDKLDPSENGSYEDAGYGYAGKIYFIATTVSGKDRGIILAEKKFRPSADQIQAEDIEEAFDNQGKLKNGLVPSISEFILRLMTNDIDDSVFSGISATNIPSLKAALLNILVNADPSTWVTNKDERTQQHFAAKQFFIDEKGRLVIALPDKNGKYHHKDFHVSKIRSDENVRKTVIAAIANNLHWNTDRTLMVQGLATGIMEALYDVFSENPELEEYSFAGLQDLTFKKSDLFTKDLEYKDVSLAAWIIGTGKLLTTVGDTLFRAPFVYADGPIITSNIAKSSAEQLTETINSRKNKNLPKEGKKEEVEDRKKSLTSRLDDYSAQRVGDLIIIQDKKQRTEAEEESGYAIKDYAILDINVGSVYEPKQDEEIEGEIKDAVKRYISFLNKNGIDISSENIKINVSSAQYNSVAAGTALFVAYVDEGSVVVTIDSLDDIESMNQEGFPVAGVYSTTQTGGKLDVDKARSWIKQTLGLTDDQIIVTNGIMRGLNNEPVYGVTETSVNILSEIVQGTFTFSKYAGRGIHYHEAFHYVNLLLHTKQQRDNIYVEYVKIHPEYRDLTKGRLEELLAEEFREYCEYLDDEEARLANYSGIRRWIARLMKRFVEFIKFWKRKDIIHKMFNDIREGKYSGMSLDEQSVSEFEKAYRGKVFSDFSVSGVKEEDLDKLKTISTYQEFYNTAEAVAHYFLDFANIKHVDNITSLNSKTIEDFFEKLKFNNSRKPNLYIQDVIDNPHAFMGAINGLLKQYGIVQKNKRSYGKKQNVDDASESYRKEDELVRPENYTIDQKTNVAFRAKLFLSQVKDVRFEYDEDSGENKLVQNIDPTTGLPMYVSYADAWHKISSELNQVDSFTELLRTVQRLGKTKAFFAQLYKNLLSIGTDTELQTQIYNTVNKHLVTVAHLALDAEKKRRRSPLDDELAQAGISTTAVKKFDEDRNIEIINDNGLKAKKMLPRDWSQDLFSSSVITFDKFYHINKSYVDGVLRPALKELQTRVLGTKNPDQKQKSEIFQWAFPRVIDLLNKMAIPFDEDVMMEYLTMHIKPKTRDLRKKEPVYDNVSTEDLFSSMQEILQNPGGSKQTGANIAFFINVVFNHSNTTDIKVGKRTLKGMKIPGYSTAKKLDELYSGFNSGEIEKMAIAYNTVHPSSRELSVTGPGGKLIYPVGENNFMSDVVRWINKNHNQFISKLQSTPYAKNSMMLDIARVIVRSGNTGNYEFKLNVFTGIQDEKSKKGVDYFGVNSIEDVVSKMLLANNNMIILPTMADKKTYYALELVSRRGDEDIKLALPHDLLIADVRSDLEGVSVRRFSNTTLERFTKYFLDELDSLDLYYKRENVAAIISNKNIRKKNFHGKIKNGRMDFSGNGGKFRYFYGLKFPGLDGEALDNINLNELLEYEYMRQLQAENPSIGEGVYSIREGEQELDGFEFIRERLKQIRNYYFTNGKPNDVLYEHINNMLFERIDENMKKFSAPGSEQIITYNPYKDPLNPNAKTEYHFYNRAIPKQLISEYSVRYNSKTSFDILSQIDSQDEKVNKDRLLNTMRTKQDDILLSIIGNFVAQSMISIIEVEKVFSGDPAFYKWNYSKKKAQKEVNGEMYEFSILTDKDTDKIKRLGALLSPGSELRNDFSETEYQRFPWLRGTKYTNATVADIKAKSVYVDEIKDIFRRQLLADILRKNNADVSLIDGVYFDDKIYNQELNKLSEEQQQNIQKSAELQAAPYTNITVSDAQVIVRPDMYRKIRMRLGQWSVIPKKIKYTTYTGEIKTTTYCDNEAFEILENDPKWMLDEEKAAKVSKLQLFPLKMTYFKNDPRNICPDYDMAYGLYNKMAIFPAFKYLMRSTTGKQVYDRMNRKGDELDMITFESAVKVGLGANIYSPYKDGTEDLSTLNDGLEAPSAGRLNSSDEESWINDPNSLNVEIQDLRGLRMQLNTEAHTDEDRAIGTQMFKIMFSNIYDNEDYIQDKDGRTPRKGKEIREDIMKCIKALTTIGVHEIKEMFYDDNLVTVDKAKVSKYLKHVAENNGLSESVLEILNTSGTIESLMQRTLFEHSVSSLVNSHVIDINTKGGSAVQQSVFGFVSYGAKNIRSEENLDDSVIKDDEEGFHVLNDGRELSWNEEDGSMEVMLSMNFFKAVVPKKYQQSYKSMRNWLIRNNVIKGYWRDPEGNIHQSHPKPFGVGYRIPTQGLSSTFAFTVADVLPEQSGDLIIVPREFTAQTGSDFDVDKLFLSTLSYKDGVLETVEGEDLTKASKGAIGNRLLQNYIDVVTDIKNRANARASIDVVTGIIQNSTLPAIRGKNEQYRDAMYELTPYFQLRRKQEFSIGKDGIGPFALNITNLALTQYAHLSLDFSELPFKMGNLDEVVGEDGIRISDWLSAMVNAHVDVAKDPYVFDLNINQLTYKYTNLLLRAGKGESTFLFLAQRAIKEYAAEWNNAGGLYGTNLRNSEKSVSRSKMLQKYKDKYKGWLDNAVNSIKDQNKKQEWLQKIESVSGEDFDWNIVFNKTEQKKALANPYSIEGLYFQWLSLITLEMLEPYAEELSELVRVSRIDTKKFGNTLALQRDFLNQYHKFKDDMGRSDVKWKITNENVERPLDNYFKNTFLETKLYAATGLMKSILSTQSFMATDTFDDMARTVMGDIFGFVEYTDANGNKVRTYDKIYGTDVVNDISLAIENVMRHRMLEHYGSPKTLGDDSYDYRQQEKNNGYSGPIDFTFGGYPEERTKELRRIMFGDNNSNDVYEQNDLFTNISMLINRLEHSSQEEREGIFSGLVNSNGRVINELLNYLRPQPANDKNPIPRLLLKKTNRNTEYSEKNKLISAFDFLLRNQTPNIRRLARDIAIYAYYSTYNTNKFNTFFDVVPGYYRKQYDEALSTAVQEENSIGSVVMLNADGVNIIAEQTAKEMIDMIGSNFWDNDNIVPVFEINPNTKKSSIHWQGGTFIGSVRNKIIFDFVTTETNKPYVKMNVDGEVYLYRKLGFFGVEKEGEIKGAKWSSYVLTPKRGIHSGSLHQYEIANDSTSDSIFAQNKMPISFNMDIVRADQGGFMQRSQEEENRRAEKGKKKKQPGKVKFVLYDRLTIEKQTQSNVHETIDAEMVNKSAGIEVSDPIEYININSDVVIDCSKQVEDQISLFEQNTQTSTEKDGYSLGVINIPNSWSETDIQGFLLKLQSVAPNITEMYVEGNTEGKKITEIYDNQDLEFADTVVLVNQKKEESEASNNDENLAKLDESLPSTESKASVKLEAEAVSKFSGTVTSEMLAELARRKAAMNNESNNTNEHEGC